MTKKEELSPEMIETAERTTKFIVDRINELLAYMMNDKFDFALIINRRTEEKSMAIFSDLDSKAELTALLRLAYTRHNDGSMHESNELADPNKTTH